MFMRDGICDLAVEGNFVCLRNYELRRDEAIFGAEDHPIIAESFSILAVQVEQRAGVRLCRADKAMIWITLPYLGTATRYDNQRPSLVYGITFHEYRLRSGPVAENTSESQQRFVVRLQEH